MIQKLSYTNKNIQRHKYKKAIAGFEPTRDSNLHNIKGI